MSKGMIITQDDTKKDDQNKQKNSKKKIEET